MSGRKKSSDGERSKSKSPDPDKAAVDKQKRRSGRRRSEMGSSNASVSSGEDVPPPPRRRAAAAIPASSGTSPTASSRSAGKRSTTSKEQFPDDATVDSKVSQSNRSTDSKSVSSKTGKEKKGSRKQASHDFPEMSTGTLAGGAAADTQQSSDGLFESSKGTFDEATDDFNFNDAAFSQAAASTTSDPLFSSNHQGGFDAFDESAFSKDFAQRASTATTDGGGENDAVVFDNAFDGAAPIFSPEPEKVWDTSPLKDMPVAPLKEYSLKQIPRLRKTFLCAPSTNPANGNILFCSNDKGSNEGYLYEVDRSHHMQQVARVPLLSQQLQKKISDKFGKTAIRIETVWNLAAGPTQRNKVNVAAVCDLKLLEASFSMRVIVVWEWNNGPPILKYVTTPPSGGDFVCDVSTLAIKDGIFFVAGKSPKGACIFVSQPATREAWSANFLTGSGSVSSISCAPSQPYLVVALTDESVTVWTFKSLTTSPSGKGSKRSLFPLCRLNHITAMQKETPEKIDGDEESGGRVADTGHCCDLSWLPPDPSLSPLLLLTVAFANGIAIFHVDLPVLVGSTKLSFQAIPESTQSTVISDTPVLSPIIVKRWIGQHESSSVSWMLNGPHIDPCLTVLLQDSVRSRTQILQYGMYFSPYHSDDSERTAPLLSVLGSCTVSQSNNSHPTGLLTTFRSKSVCSYSTNCISSVSLSSQSPHSSKAVIDLSGYGTTSIPPGLTSNGDIFFVDASSDTDGILYIYSMLHCDRSNRNDPVESSIRSWSAPMRRNWLCCSFVGDSKETCLQEESKVDRGFGDTEEVFGCSPSSVLCELDHTALAGLVPFRIVRCTDKKICAVLFRPSLGSSSDVNLKLRYRAVAIAMVDYSSEKPVVDVVKARDMAFFSSGENSKEPCGVMLESDGSCLTFFAWSSSKVVRETSFRPLVGVDTQKNYIDCHRIAVFSEGTKLSMAVFGQRYSDDRVCLIVSDVCDVEDMTGTQWSKIIPNVVSGRSVWFEPGEEIRMITGLQGDGRGYRNFAVSTSARVAILSSALTIAAEYKQSCESNLSPLGSFAVCFSSERAVKYLCCLRGNLAHGVIASGMQSKYEKTHSAILGVRPDRLIYSPSQSGVLFVEPGRNPNTFQLPVARIRPALLLEPMVANAVCVGGKLNQSTPTLRLVIEKFGRIVTATTHSEKEGIGSYGSGLTPTTFMILDTYNLKHAASWLLTGSVNFDRASNTRVLPPWAPLGSKCKGAIDSNALLHVFSAGDTYLTDSLKDPDATAAMLPRQSDPISHLAKEYALSALGHGKPCDSLKLLDLVGTESSDGHALQLALLLDKKKNVGKALDTLSGSNNKGFSSSASVKAPASLAAIAVSLGLKGRKAPGVGMTAMQTNRWMSPLAPSLQCRRSSQRLRPSIFSQDQLDEFERSRTDEDVSDKFWKTPCNDSKHVWNEGPKKEKDNLLVLDNIEDWLGRKRPLIFGKEGAIAAKERGETTLANILNQDDDSFGGGKEVDGLESVRGDGWVDGVGEGRSDEANLSCYLRMSEGDDEDFDWKNEGFVDLSPYKNKARLSGDKDKTSLQKSTSGVDEGEEGKVKSLFDLVFEDTCRKGASGLYLDATRGGSLDIGLLHAASQSSRMKCSIEFWYYLPPVEDGMKDIVLARRTIGTASEDGESEIAPEKNDVLWELVLKEEGELQFRTGSGSGFVSSQNAPSNPSDTDESAQEKPYLASFERWNHVCVVLTSKGLSPSQCKVSLFMKGTEAASAVLNMLPTSFTESEISSDTSRLSTTLAKSKLFFGLNHTKGYRLTELRVWACERTAADTQSFMYEYLTAAEQKKKFKVKIANKNKKGIGIGTGLGLAAPKGSGGTRSGGLAPPRLVPRKSGNLIPLQGLSLAPPPKGSTMFGAELTETNDKIFAKQSTSSSARSALLQSETSDSRKNLENKFDASFGALNFSSDGTANAPTEPMQSALPPTVEHEDPVDDEEEEDVATTLWDTALPLAQQIRPSAAAALIRGPPATRHYGGNRGGLPDFSGVERFGVGGIAICGSEKTIVFRDNEEPPALTYPIGASGAVVSDQMDDEGSEFLCCFLAKEGRMVVFELRSRTVVVELQMTTKLNYWRYLPPEAAENTLCFMLVTPVGGFHWMPLEEAPRPHQVWKRGPELHGKKVCSYEEGGSNGLDGHSIRSSVGLVLATHSHGSGKLEGWILPISGDSQARQVSDNMLGACLCQPLDIDDRPFLPHLVTVHDNEGSAIINVVSIKKQREGSIKVGSVLATQIIEEEENEGSIEYEAPALAMGPLPEAICVSLSNIVVVILRRKGLVAAFEVEENELNLIAQESVDHFVIDAVMRYSAEIGGAEIVMLLSDDQNAKDGRIVSFCFRSAV